MYATARTAVAPKIVTVYLRMLLLYIRVYALHLNRRASSLPRGLTPQNAPTFTNNNDDEYN